MLTQFANIGQMTPRMKAALSGELTSNGLHQAPNTGTLASIQSISTLEPGFNGQNTTVEIQLTPDGKHVLASNRGDNSLAVFDVNASDGKLTRTARVSTGGATPRHFSIDETGKFLFAGNQGSGNVVEMKLDATTGIPSAVGCPTSVPSPAYVGMFYLPL